MTFDLEVPLFRPHPLLRSGHAQTILGNTWGQKPRPHGRVQHRIQLDDGDLLVLHDDHPDMVSDRIVVLIHGLGGCHSSSYLQRLAVKLGGQRIRTLRLDQRGCGTGEPLANRMAHAGRGADLLACLNWVASQHPHVAITACGFSLGAAILLKAVSSTRSLPDTLDSVIAVSPPIDLLSCCLQIPWFYDRYYARRLWAAFQRRSARLDGSHQLRIPRRPETVLEFDRWITAPLNGFDSVEHYYGESSAAADLHRISIPTLILAAEDDPIVPIRVFDGVRYSAHTSLIRPMGGGHLGFVASRTASARESDLRWLEWRLVDWITSLTP